MENIILGLDISTTCIGYCLFFDDETNGKIIKMGHISPKIPNNIKGIEALFLKKKIFKEEFITKMKNYNITNVVIEEPLLSSNNINTVATLIRFNTMISDCIYTELGKIPQYISSYDARMYAFPELMSVRKFNKKGEQYPIKKILNSLKKNELTLFGAYPYDVAKKIVVWNKVMELFKDIAWVFDKHGDLKKENFDANDALIACLGFLHREKYGDLVINISNIEIHDNIINYDINYWNNTLKKEIILE